MSDTLTVTATLELSVREVLDTTDMPTGSTENDRTLRHNEFNGSAKLSATTTPKAERAVISKLTLGAGITTIDLTAATKSAGRVESMAGKKVVAYIIETNIGNNAAGVTIAPGAANPYPLFGAAKSVILGPGRTDMCAFAQGVDSNLPAVAGGVKNIDVSGTTGDKVNIELIFGT
jgi:hypothetical protein